MMFRKNSKLVMIGDSITDAGRNRDCNGEGIFNPHGNGYVSLVNAFLQAFYPELRIRVINKGVSGNTVRDLRERWERDVLDLKPDYVSIMIGINDVWRQFDSALMTESFVTPDEYEKLLGELIETTRPQAKGLILCTPYFIEANRADQCRMRMEEYASIMRRLALRYNIPLVDTQAAFDTYLKQYHSAMLGWDRVHPNMSGHMLIARAWMNTVGFDWNHS